MSTNDSIGASPRQDHRLVTARDETNDELVSSSVPAEQSSHQAETIQIGQADRPSAEDASLPANTSLAQLDITPTEVEQTVTSPYSQQSSQSWVELLRNNPNSLHEAQNSETGARAQLLRDVLGRAHNRNINVIPDHHFALLLPPGYPLPRMYENLLFEPRPSEQDLDRLNTLLDLPHPRHGFDMDNTPTHLTIPLTVRTNVGTFVEQEMATRNARMNLARQHHQQQQQAGTAIDAESQPVLVLILRDTEDEGEPASVIQDLERLHERNRAEYYQRLRNQAQRYVRPSTAIHNQAPANHEIEAENQPGTVQEDLERVRERVRAEHYERLRERARRYTHPATIHDRPVTTHNEAPVTPAIQAPDQLIPVHQDPERLPEYHERMQNPARPHLPLATTLNQTHANQPQDQPNPGLGANGVADVEHLASVWEAFGRRMDTAISAQRRRVNSGGVDDDDDDGQSSTDSTGESDDDDDDDDDDDEAQSSHHEEEQEGEVTLTFE